MTRFSGLVDHPTPAPYPFGPPDVASILDAGLADHPDRLALIDGDRSWTWAELDAAVSRTAAGIAPEEQMWFALGNRAETVIGALATFRAGAIAIFLPGNRTVWRFQGIDDQVGPTTIIDSVDAFARIASTAVHRSHVEVDPMAPAAIAFTSGTSGFPKAVVHSQRNLLLPGLLSIDAEPPTVHERLGTPLSLQIMNVMALGPLSALLRGSTFVVLARQRAGDLAIDIDRHQVNRLFAVPTQLHDLIEHGDIADALPSLERIIVGGAGAEADLLRSFTERFGVRPTLSYGMTETPTGVVRESLDDPIGSGRGFPLPHISVSIRDESGNECPTGVSGEVCLARSVGGRWANCWTPTLGYLGEPERTASLFAGGVLHTGDIGRLDEDGGLSVTGRLSNLIIRGGMNVDPIAIEETIRSLQSIDDVVVLGIPDDRLGQRVAAVIVPNSKAQLDFAAVRAHVLETMSKHAVPDVIVVSEALMKNDMGKVVRHWPRDLFDDGDMDMRDPAPVTTMLINRPGTLEE